jgi:hypothetical protein
MTHRNAPGCGQILAACGLVIVGALGGCTVGGIFASTGIAPDAIWWLGIVGGLIAGGVLASLVLRPPGRR